MADHYHKPKPPNEAAAPETRARQRRLLRWVLLALLGVFLAVMVVAVLQVFVGPSA